MQLHMQCDAHATQCHSTESTTAPAAATTTMASTLAKHGNTCSCWLTAAHTTTGGCRTSPVEDKAATTKQHLLPYHQQAPEQLKRSHHSARC
jgi:hypothetical protein